MVEKFVHGDCMFIFQHLVWKCPISQRVNLCVGVKNCNGFVTGSVIRVLFVHVFCISLNGNTYGNKYRSSKGLGFNLNGTFFDVCSCKLIVPCLRRFKATLNISKTSPN